MTWPTNRNSPIFSAADIPARHRRHLLVGLIACYVLAIGIWPLLRLFAEAMDPALIHQTLTARATGRALANTLRASAGSVAISVGAGTALALAVGMLALRGRVAMTFLILSPLLVPSQIMALAWIELIGTVFSGSNPLYSGTGVAVLMGIEHMPLVFIAVRAGLGAIPADLIEAARIAGASQGRILWRIILPLTLPAMGAGAILAFAAAIGNFGVPALLGIPGRFPMLTTLIYQRLNGFGPSVLGQVAVLALLLVAMAGVALVLRALLLRTVPLVQGAPFAPFKPARRAWIEAALWLVLGVLMVLPILALLGTALSPALGVRLTPQTASLGNFVDALANPAIRRAFFNSLMLSGAAAAISGLVALPLAWLSTVARNPVMRQIDWMADAPWVVPGTVLALAAILVFLPPLPLIGSIYGTPAILLVAYLARFLPLVLRPVQASAAACDPALDEAARLFGAGTFMRIARIFAPIAAPSAMAGAILIFMTAFNELTLSSLLWSSGTETVGVMIFTLQYEGNSTGAAAISVLSLGLVAMLAWGLDRICRAHPGLLPWRA